MLVHKSMGYLKEGILMIHVLVNGASGRMGSEVVRSIWAKMTLMYAVQLIQAQQDMI